ncbi:methyl-accepting chemotaxis protein [Pseudomonas hormoni]
MDKTRRNLRELLSHVNGITIQLASAAEQLSAVTKQTSAGVTNQRLETDQVATAMNEMAATVHEVAQNAQEASVAAQSADKQAVQGNAAIQRALIQIDKLSEEVSRSADAVAHLNKESVGISTVLTVINGIAEQTNLLALNAAIEAARAGEAGRGFAVVADEVRGLAQRTQQSTRQIEELISNLQAGAQNAANMMSASSTLVDETVNRAHEVQTELAAITQTVSLIQAMNMQIATAAEEQSAVAEEINRSVLNVRDVAEQSAAASEETAASTMELARLGNELQQQVGRFKV